MNGWSVTLNVEAGSMLLILMPAESMDERGQRTCAGNQRVLTGDRLECRPSPSINPEPSSASVAGKSNNEARRAKMDWKFDAQRRITCSAELDPALLPQLPNSCFLLHRDSPPKASVQAHCSRDYGIHHRSSGLWLSLQLWLVLTLL